MMKPVSAFAYSGTGILIPERENAHTKSSAAFPHDSTQKRLNIFNSSALYQEIDAIRLRDSEDFNGPAFACVFPTGICKSGCPQCFFKSIPRKSHALPEEESLSEEGIVKTIRFLNDAKIEYLLISGGGEPTENLSAVLSLVRNVKTAKRIVLVTAGYFATNAVHGASLINQLQQALADRGDKTELVLRLSLDAGHYQNLGQKPAINLINHFADMENPQFTLELHTMIGDDTVDRVASLIGAHVKDIGENTNDGDALMKNVPYRREMYLPNGRVIKVGCAKLFYPSLVKDLSDKAAHNKAIYVYMKDMLESELDNPSVAFSGKDNSVRGMDIWITQNGNVSSWGNAMPGHITNIYTDTYSDFRKEVMSVPGMRAYVEYGDSYRSRIIGEVDPAAVFRTRAINIRDYAGQQILQEERTRQYYTIRSIQTLIKGGLLTEDCLAHLSSEARDVINMPVELLKEQYHLCRNDMAWQSLIRYGNDVDAMADSLLLIKRAHFSCDPDNVAMLLKRYCQLSGKYLAGIDDIEADSDAGRQYARLKDRMTALPQHVAEYLARCGKEVEAS